MLSRELIWFPHNEPVIVDTTDPQELWVNQHELQMLLEDSFADIPKDSEQYDS